MKELILRRPQRLLAVWLLVWLFACGGAPADGSAAMKVPGETPADTGLSANEPGVDDPARNYTTQSPETFLKQVRASVEQYHKLREALIASNFERAVNSAAAMLTQLEQVYLEELPASQQQYWKDQVAGVEESLQAIAAAKEIEEQRVQFARLTQPLKQIITNFSVNNQTLYVQHCPMAFGNKGASWISTDEEIRNPYYGDKMLTCGRVEDTLPAGS